MQSEETRKKIIKSATEQFIANGCRRITMDNVANELHISKRTLYEYFETKEELLMACMVMLKEDIGNKIRMFKCENDSPIARLLLIFRYMAISHSQLATLLTDIREYYPGIYQKMFPRREAFHTSYLHQKLQEALDCGDLRAQVDIDQAVETLMHIIQHYENDSHNSGMNNYCEAGYTYVRGLLSVDAIQRYDQQESHIKELMKINS